MLILFDAHGERFATRYTITLRLKAILIFFILLFLSYIWATDTKYESPTANLKNMSPYLFSVQIISQSGYISRISFLSTDNIPCLNFITT